jgi:hypothetical protein
MVTALVRFMPLCTLGCWILRKEMVKKKRHTQNVILYTRRGDVRTLIETMSLSHQSLAYATEEVHCLLCRRVGSSWLASSG